MKLKLLDRILIGILLILAILAAFLLFAVSVGAIPARTAAALVAAAGTGFRNRVLLAFSGLFLLLISLKIVFAGRSGDPADDRTAVIETGELGTTSISLSALDTMIKRHCAQEPCIADCFTVLQPDEDGLSVGLRLTVWPETELAPLASRMQKSVQEYLESATGIPVKDVSVLIESAKD